MTDLPCPILGCDQHQCEPLHTVYLCDDHWGSFTKLGQDRDWMHTVLNENARLTKETSMQRPNDIDTCENAGCSHTFGEHYASFNGLATGCSHKAYAQRDADCSCKGFMQIYRPVVVGGLTVDASTNSDYAGR